MKRALQINIGGRHFYIDEDAYNLLNEYMESLRSYFMKEGDAGKEIIEDIEQRLAELLEEQISEKKQVLSINDINEAIKTLGKVEDFEFERASDEKEINEEQSTYNWKDYRRLFRDPDNSYLGGVCGGLGAYFNIDSLWLRIIFIALIFANGIGIILYAVLWIVLPKAKTTAQKLQMRGEPVTVENIKRSINEEYQKVRSNLENISESEGFKRSKEVAGDIFTGIGNIIVAFLRFIVYLVGFVFLIVGIFLLIGLGTAFFTRFHWFHHLNWPRIYLPDLSAFFTNPTTTSIVAVCIVILVVIPLTGLIVGGIKLLLNIRSRNRFLRATAFTAWFLAFFVLIAMIITEGDNFGFKAIGSNTTDIKEIKSPTYYLKLEEDYDTWEDMTIYSFFGFDFYYNSNDDRALSKPKLTIEKGNGMDIQLTIKKQLKNINMKHSHEYFEDIEYDWYQKDSILVFEEFFSFDEEYKWRFPEIELILKVPENQEIYIGEQMDKILTYCYNTEHYWKDEMTGNRWIMTKRGLERVDE